MKSLESKSSTISVENFSRPSCSLWTRWLQKTSLKTLKVRNSKVFKIKALGVFSTVKNTTKNFWSRKSRWNNKSLTSQSRSLKSTNWLERMRSTWGARSWEELFALWRMALLQLFTCLMKSTSQSFWSARIPKKQRLDLRQDSNKLQLWVSRKLLECSKSLQTELSPERLLRAS